jgi:hypothetical protein
MRRRDGVDEHGQPARGGDRTARECVARRHDPLQHGLATADGLTPNLLASL